VLHFDQAWTYMYKGYTVPAYRGKRLHAVGMCRALRAFTEEARKADLVRGLHQLCLASFGVTHGLSHFREVYMLRAGGRSFTYATRAAGITASGSNRPLPTWRWSDVSLEPHKHLNS